MTHLLLSIFFIALLAGCDSKPEVKVTNTQAIYETIFLKVIGNTYNKYHLVETTESAWFIKHPYETEDWNTLLDSSDAITPELIKELYRVNASSLPLNWTPFLTNAKFLPSHYNDGPSQIENHCFVEEKDATIDIRSNGSYYRSYYSISNVAFSSNNETAIVKYSRHCAPLTGAGEFIVVLQRINKQWQVIGGINLWIS
jgi:hypothetical protein